MNGEIPILGVCLGHQCIGAEFGAPVVPAKRPLHGRVSHLAHTGERLFEGLPQQLTVGRYHSLIVQPTPQMDAALITDAISEEGEIMALSHRTAPTYGVQFHPEVDPDRTWPCALRQFFETGRHCRRAERRAIA